MNVQNLLIGTVSIGIIYALIGPSEIDNEFFFIAPFEGLAYSFVVVISHREVSIKATVCLFALAALLNYLVVQFWWAFVAIPTLLGAEALSPPFDKLVVFSFHSAAGAVLFALLLDWLLQPDYFSTRTYILAMLFTSVAGIPLALEMSFNVEIHKITWWLGFSIALITSYSLDRKLNANKHMRSDRPTACA